MLSSLRKDAFSPLGNRVVTINKCALLIDVYSMFRIKKRGFVGIEFSPRGCAARCAEVVLHHDDVRSCRQS